MDGRPQLAVVGNSLRRGFGPPQPVGHETGQKGPFEISVAAKWDYCGFSRRPEWLQWWTLVLVVVAGKKGGVRRRARSGKPWWGPRLPDWLRGFVSRRPLQQL